MTKKGESSLRIEVKSSICHSATSQRQTATSTVTNIAAQARLLFCKSLVTSCGSFHFQMKARVSRFLDIFFIIVYLSSSSWVRHLWLNLILGCTEYWFSFQIKTIIYICIFSTIRAKVKTDRFHFKCLWKWSIFEKYVIIFTTNFKPNLMLIPMTHEK